MLDAYASQNVVDDKGMPAGGWVDGAGLSIDWQDGPLGRGAERKPPNGAFVETVIDAARQRIEWYQEVNDGQFACEENRQAIEHLRMALNSLAVRTERRERAGVEGTHEGN